ncbi:glycosyltransferase [Candidatus Poribacteria bacterium]|nr:glycosyltransferase [Candidatus Poribacteria bacterium]
MREREKILFLSPQVPEFDKYSGWVRLSRVIEILSEHYEVFFLAERKHAGYSGGDDRYTSFLKKHGVRLFIEDYNLSQILLMNTFKLAIVEFFHTGERHLEMMREAQPELNVVLDTVDVHFLREQTMANVTEALDDEEEARRTKERELKICQSVEAVFAVTEADKETLLREDAALTIEVIPNIHRVIFEDSRIREREQTRLLFVGGFKHPPNVDAVLYFCSEVLPLVQEEKPSAEVLIIGDSPPPEVCALASQTVKILGQVPDTAPYLQESYISVAPLRFGAGMKGKIGEALSYGLPIVTTSVGVQGLSLAHGNDVLVADNPADFAKCILQLMSDRELYCRMARNGPEFIKRTCTPEIVGEKLLEFIEGSPESLKPRRAANLIRESKRLSFDIYQRYKIVADAIDHMRDSHLKILDVGGRGDLVRFLPNDFVATVDRNRYFRTRASVVADGITLPFREKAFDYVLAVDMIEHLPINQRNGFIDELDRVAAKGIVLGAPFRSDANKESENLLSEFHRSLYGAENPWLAEHMRNGLPDLEATTDYVKKKGFTISVLPNGYVNRWTVMMGLSHVLAKITDGDGLLRNLSEFYNKNYYSMDNKEPCYRHIIVAVRQNTPPDIGALYPLGAVSETDSLAEEHMAFFSSHYLQTLHLLHENEKLLKQTQMHLRDCENVVQSLLSRWPVRIYRRLKAMLRKK